MVTDAELEEAFRAATVLADAGHDASAEWDRYYELLDQAAAAHKRSAG